MDKENYTVDIIDLIPVGQSNAISRKNLTDKCISYGLIDGKAKNADRHMRKLLNNAKKDHVIINLQDGGGYFQPGPDDKGPLQWWILQESHRILNVAAPLRHAEKLLNDMKAGRV